MPNNFDKNSKPHKFFERFLDIDLAEAADLLRHEYGRIERHEMRGIKTNNFEDPFSYTKSVSTAKSREYNAFQIYFPFMHDIYSAITDMVVEACKYYDLDYNSEKWGIAAWFNINSREKGAKLDWHDHIPPGNKIAAFHGYFSVNAEPSETWYNIDGQMKVNQNKNNRAILSMVGYQHAMAPWEWEGDRITIAYDVIPYSILDQLENERRDSDPSIENRLNWEQHFFPMPQIPADILEKWQSSFK